MTQGFGAHAGRDMVPKGETASAKNRSFPRALEPTQAATHKSIPKQVLL